MRIGGRVHPKVIDLEIDPATTLEFNLQAADRPVCARSAGSLQ
jgi:hypothetical protein